jgi:hypothetical protein
MVPFEWVGCGVGVVVVHSAWCVGVVGMWLCVLLDVDVFYRVWELYLC